MNRLLRWGGFCLALMAGAWCLTPVAVVAQGPSERILDQILDQYVRDGLVYYASLRRERRLLDRYVESLAPRPSAFATWSAERRLAYWINGYNALVLRTVIDHYPIRGTSSNFPESSVMQVPGMFAGREHLIAGDHLTLQGIEDQIGDLGDPRVYLALGRGAVGSPRLRSEAFDASRFEIQLQAVVADFATTTRHIHVDPLGDRLVVNAVLGWQAARFASCCGGVDDNDETGRTSFERAVVALIEPALFPSERDYLAENTFRLSYRDFDWRLNDLTGGAPTPRSVSRPVGSLLGGRPAN